MQELADRRSRIATARGIFLRFGRAQTEAVPGIVAASWQRSLSAGVDASTSQAVYHSDLDLSGRLMRCSEPVIARLSDEMADMPLSIVLSDSKAGILSRTETDRTIGMLLDKVSLAPGFNYAEGSVGTNGIGSVFESGQPLYIVGPEHFHEQLQPFACAGSPIRDPLTGRVEGVLDISCLSEHSSPLMSSLVRSAARDIEHNLLVDRSKCQQALFEAFIRFDARKRGAVMAVGGTVAMSNVVAQALFDPAEQWTIQEHARYLMLSPVNPVDQIELSSGKVVQIRGTRIVAGKDVAGIVVSVGILSEAAPTLHEVPAAANSTGDARPASGPATQPLSILGGGRSPLWKRACNEIVAALGENRALLVMGEPGCGKASLVDDLFHRVVPNGRSVVFDSADTGRPGFGEAEQGLTEDGVPTLYTFTNIDKLGTAGIEGLSAFLDALAASDQPVFIAATVSDSRLDSHPTFRELLTHFEKAVTVPPLRHRIEDLPVLVERMLATVTGRQGVTISPAALRVISGYGWPKNLRQLEEALESAVLKRPVGEIQVEDLPGFCRGGAHRQLSALEAVERDMIVAALQEADGNRVHAAAALGMARSSLYRKLKGFGISTS